MKKTLFFTLLLIPFNLLIHSQTGINIDNPNPNTLLHVSEKKTITAPDANNVLKGIIIPRLTEAERDKLTYVDPSALPKVIRLQSTDNSLMIFNTSENCFNYWNHTEQEWNSLCGKLGKSIFSIDCNTIEATGSYIINTELNGSNTLKLTTHVTKPGDYTISATTSNGYNFFTSGTFLSAGDYTIIIPGQGKPTNIQTDQVSINLNGIDTTCSPAVSIDVLSASGTYTLNCSTAKANGVYKIGVALSGTNTVTVPVNVTVLGSYSITTNTVDGISFSGSGTFTSLGNQNVILYGTGTPISSDDKIITMTSDSKGSGNKTCSFKVIITLAVKRMLCIGSSPNSLGYNVGGTAASGRMVSTPDNFGDLINSVIKTEPINRIINESPSTSELNTLLLGPNPVDIVVMGYPWLMTESEADIIKEYLLRKGVVIAYSESNSGNNRLFRAIFNDLNINSSNQNAAGALYKFPLLDDPILNGPFGDIRGKHWGEDASATSSLTNVPTTDIIVYSSDADESQTTPTSTGGITSFRHKLFNLVWVGDGGFNSNTGSSETAYPFVTTVANYPTFKPSYGRGGESLDQDVYNAVFTANAIAWAIKQAELNGINTP